MKLKDIAIAVFSLALVAIVGYLWLSPSGMKSAPAVQMTTLQGEQLSLASLRDKPVMVVFWATTCPGCVEEIPHLADLYRDYHARGLEVIGVAMSYDPEDQVREMVRQRQIPYSIALDRDGSLAQAFGDVKLTPTSFLIDPQGRIVQQKLGVIDMNVVRQRINSMLGKG